MGEGSGDETREGIIWENPLHTGGDDWGLLHGIYVKEFGVHVFVRIFIVVIGLVSDPDSDVQVVA